MKQTFHCLKCGQKNIPNQLGHLKDCDNKNYQKAIKLTLEIDTLLETIERLENETAISKANIHKNEIEIDRLNKELEK